MSLPIKELKCGGALPQTQKNIVESLLRAADEAEAAGDGRDEILSTAMFALYSLARHMGVEPLSQLNEGLTLLIKVNGGTL